MPTSTMNGTEVVNTGAEAQGKPLEDPHSATHPLRTFNSFTAQPSNDGSLDFETASMGGLIINPSLLLPKPMAPPRVEYDSGGYAPGCSSDMDTVDSHYRWNSGDDIEKASAETEKKTTAFAVWNSRVMMTLGVIWTSLTVCWWFN